MREITSHKVNGLNEDLTIEVLDEPGAGGACHEYEISDLIGHVECKIRFQKGPIAEAGVNGISNEALLAIVEDRLRCFEAGPYACSENACALDHVQLAMQWLQQRTLERVARGVEGTRQK